MALEQARELAHSSTVAKWRFPTSSGKPIPSGDVAASWASERLGDLNASFTALERLVEEGDATLAQQLAANSWRLWLMASDVPGGRAFLSVALDGRVREASRDRALALYGDSLLAFYEDNAEDVGRRSHEALEIARTIGDDEAHLFASLGLSRAAFMREDFEETRSRAAEACTFAAGLDPAMGQAPRHMLGQAKRFLGDLDGAAVLFRESLQLNREIEDIGMVGADLHNLGHVEIHRGNIDEAARCFEECAEMTDENNSYVVALNELNKAIVARARGDGAEARRLLASTDSILEQRGVELAQDDRYELEEFRRSL